MLVYVIHVVHNCLSIGFLVKYDQKAIYVPYVVYYFFAFQRLFYIYIFLQGNEGKSLLYGA